MPHRDSSGWPARPGESAPMPGRQVKLRRAGDGAGKLDFQTIGAVALRNAEAIIRRVIPGGSLRGCEYMALNPNRADTQAGSFKINMVTGRWADFATGERGGDLISLLAWRYGVSQSDAARQLASFLSLDTEARR